MTHLDSPGKPVAASFTASGGTMSAFGRDTLGGGHQQAGELMEVKQEARSLLEELGDLDEAPEARTEEREYKEKGLDPGDRNVSRPNADVVPPEAVKLALERTHWGDILLDLKPLSTPSNISLEYARTCQLIVSQQMPFCVSLSWTHQVLIAGLLEFARR
ncbi:hypothetical protein Bbelb_277650 [Branchiostoma belcheri]|nr:hypothetical protein Bbelb_277650 [Branchiostoma belcheri]